MQDDHEAQTASPGLARLDIDMPVDTMSVEEKVEAVAAARGLGAEVI